MTKVFYGNYTDERSACKLWAGHYTHQHETEDKAKEECIEELHLNRQLVDGIDLNHILPENDTNLNVLLACVWKKEGLQDDTGDINWRNLEKSFLKIVRENLKIKPKLESVISAGVEAKAIKACNKQNIIGKNDGQTIAKTQNCILWEVFKSVL
ncbi:hypothetical protein ILUMI_10843 [Ignelater luminosus]|uniref:Uncharacterized protein n=1 Tax=Ignelater luminosus TaxID=2038154 RepID=A0A8K0D1C6_IGNLU|nr:hypothetical protein ILUMI_10843 [Ignelater luminosus]